MLKIIVVVVFINNKILFIQIISIRISVNCQPVTADCLAAFDVLRILYP